MNLAIVLDKVLGEISLFIWKAPYLNISLWEKRRGASDYHLRERERNYAYQFFDLFLDLPSKWVHLPVLSSYILISGYEPGYYLNMHISISYIQFSFTICPYMDPAVNTTSTNQALWISECCYIWYQYSYSDLSDISFPR